MSGNQKTQTKKKTNIELGLYGYDLKYDFLQKVGFFATYHKLHAVSVPIGLIDKIQPYLLGVKLACLIDAPYGMSILEIKHHSIIKAIHKEAQIIEMVLNNCLVINKDWDKLHHEIKTCYELCQSKNVEFRIALDWRLWEGNEAVELCQALAYTGIDAIVTSNGMAPDDASDNILFSRKVEKQYKMPMVCCSPMFRESHLATIAQTKYISGMRILNYELAKRFLGSAGV